MSDKKRIYDPILEDIISGKGLSPINIKSDSSTTQKKTSVLNSQVSDQDLLGLDLQLFASDQDNEKGSE